MFLLGLVSKNRIFQAVLKYGVAQWFSIGLAVELTSSQIASCTFDKPLHASKLEAIIEDIVREQGVKKAEESLLTACAKIHPPIIGSVEEYIQSSSNKMGEDEKGSVPVQYGNEASKGTEESSASSQNSECENTNKMSTKSQFSWSCIRSFRHVFVGIIAIAMVVLWSYEW